MDDVHSTNGYIFFNVAQKLKYGAFKSMQEGQIDIVQCPFLTVAGAALVALKQPYMDNPGTTEDDTSFAIPLMLSLSPDDQVRELTADALLMQWANSLLQDVYDFISEYKNQASTRHLDTCPDIPSFQFVTTGLAVTDNFSKQQGSFPCQRAHLRGRWPMEEIHQ